MFPRGVVLNVGRSVGTDVVIECTAKSMAVLPTGFAASTNFSTMSLVPDDEDEEDDAATA